MYEALQPLQATSALWCEFTSLALKGLKVTINLIRDAATSH